MTTNLRPKASQKIGFKKKIKKSGRLQESGRKVGKAYRNFRKIYRNYVKLLKNMECFLILLKISRQSGRFLDRFLYILEHFPDSREDF